MLVATSKHAGRARGSMSTSMFDGEPHSDDHIRPVSAPLGRGHGVRWDQHPARAAYLESEQRDWLRASLPAGGEREGRREGWEFLPGRGERRQGLVYSRGVRMLDSGYADHSTSVTTPAREGEGAEGRYDEIPAGVSIQRLIEQQILTDRSKLYAYDCLHTYAQAHAHAHVRICVVLITLDNTSCTR